MYTLTEQELRSSLSDLGTSEPIALQEFGGNLIRDISRHEVEVILSHRTALIEGRANKRGFKYVRISRGVDPRTVTRLLLRTVTRNTVPRAEDSKTFSSQHIGKGVCYSHRRNDFYAPVVRFAGSGKDAAEALLSLGRSDCRRSGRKR